MARPTAHETIAYRLVQILQRLNNGETLETDIFVPDPAIADYLGREDSIWLNTDKTEDVLKIAPPAASYFERRQLIGSQKIEKILADGSLIVSGQIAHPNQILPVVRYGLPCIRVISPEGLQADLNQQLKEYLETT